MALSALQEKRMAILLARQAASVELSPRQLAKLERYQVKLAEMVRVAEVPNESTKRKAEEEVLMTVREDSPAPKKRVYKAEPCRDQGHWGSDGEWVYPVDRQITCSTCKASFTFSGTEQAWYAKKELYAPARCPDCIASKKEARHVKKQQVGHATNRCFNCGRDGHAAASCPEKRSETKVCYVCGSEAHFSRNCPDAAGKKKNMARGCFTCGSTAHLSRECPQRPTPVCFNCGETGHAQKACSKALRTSGACFAFAKGQCFSNKCKFEH
jgi:hypothetical protein